MARTFDEITRGSYTIRNFTVSGGSQVFGSANIVTNQQSRHAYNYRSDIVKTPGISTLRKTGAYLPPLPYFWDIIRETFYPGSYERWQAASSGYQVTGLAHSRMSTFYASSAEVEDWGLPSWTRTDAFATNKILGKVKDQKVNLLQAFAERAQTARLLVQSVSGISELLLAVISKDWRRVSNLTGMTRKQVQDRAKGFRRLRKKAGLAADRISEQWLAVQYGWKPLVSDIYGVCDELTSRQFDPQAPWVTAAAGSKEKINETLGPLMDVYSQGLKRTSVSKLTVGTYFRLDYKLPRPDREQLKALGLSNPALIAWELMPWSFVIDWLLPVGSWVSAFDATVGLTFVGGSRTRWFERQVTTNHTPDNIQRAGYWHRGKGLRYMATRKYGQRVVLTSTPLPKPPKFKNPYSIIHLANAMSLLTQLRSRGSTVR